MKTLVFAMWLLLAELLLGGCGVTYPKKTFTQDLEKLVKKECKYDVKVCILGKALYLDIEFEGLKKKETILQARHVMWKVVDIVDTAVLSTDANLKHMVVTTYDRNSRVAIRIVKNLDDLKRFINRQISVTDYNARFIHELVSIEEAINNKHDITEEEYVGRLIASQLRIANFQLYAVVKDKNLYLLMYDNVDAKDFSAKRDMLRNEIKNNLKKYRNVYFKEIKLISLSGEVLLTIIL